MMDLFEALKGRRSVREFLPDEVPEEHLELILDMARYAPTAGNLQPWKFLIVRERTSKKGLREEVKVHLRMKIDKLELPAEEKREQKERAFRFADRILSAPVLIFVFVDASFYPDLVGYDGAMAVQNLMLAAYALGYGTSFQTTLFPEELVKEHFSVPEHYRFICAVPLGKPAAWPEMPKKKELRSFIWGGRAEGG
jgi:nitroreductase